MTGTPICQPFCGPQGTGTGDPRAAWPPPPACCLSWSCLGGSPGLLLPPHQNLTRAGPSPGAPRPPLLSLSSLSQQRGWEQPLCSGDTLPFSVGIQDNCAATACPQGVQRPHSAATRRLWPLLPTSCLSLAFLGVAPCVGSGPPHCSSLLDSSQAFPPISSPSAPHLASQMGSRSSHHLSWIL